MSEDLRAFLLGELRRGLLAEFPGVLREPALFADAIGGRAVDAAVAAGWTVRAIGAEAKALTVEAFATRAADGGEEGAPPRAGAARSESHARERLTALALLLHAPGGRSTWLALEREYGADLPCWEWLEELPNLDELRAAYATELGWAPSLAALARRFGNGRGDAAETEEQE